jgi:GAF domain-containing protein
LRNLIGTLEERVADRTRELERRAVQLATASDVGRVAASFLELETLSREVVELVRERFGLYYVSLFLLDDVGEHAVLEAGTGDAGRIMKEADHKLEVGGASMVGSACAQRQARIALDVGEEPVRFDNPLLPNTRSEMALPLVVGERVLGALDVQSTQQAAFSEEDITILQLVADQVAVAVDNARKFSEEAGLLEATSPLYRISRRMSAVTTTDEIVQAIIDSVAETEADGCAVGRLAYTPDGEIESATFLGAWSRHREPQFPTGVSFAADASPIPLDIISTFWVIEDITQTDQVPEGPRQFLAQSGGWAYANVPLRIGDQTTGFVSIQRTTPGPFSPVSIRLYETLVDQAAVTMERARLLEESQVRASRERTIREITDGIRSSVTIEEAIQQAIRAMGRVLGASEMVAQIGTEQGLHSEQGGNGHE